MGDGVSGHLPPPSGSSIPHPYVLVEGQISMASDTLFSNGAPCAGTLKSFRPTVEKPAHSSVCVMAYALLSLPHGRCSTIRC